MSRWKPKTVAEKKQLSENWRDKGRRIDGEEKKWEGKKRRELEEVMR